MKTYFSGGQWAKFGTSSMPMTHDGLPIPQRRLIHRVHRRWRSNRSSSQTSSGRGLRKPAFPNAGSHYSIDVSLRQFALSEARCGNYETAIEAFNSLLEQSPHSAVDYNNRGLVHFRNGNLKQSLEDYNTAIALNPNLDNVYNNRANFHALERNFLEAILDYDTALELNPSNIRAWINQGITFRDMSLYEHALENFDVALHLSSESRSLSGHIYAERGRVYHLDGDWNCAIADYHRAIAHLPKPIPPFNSPSLRLRVQVEIWLDDLLSPIQVER
jgi:tetratricopeptide (TPR) repeat protein